jgi:hypothetical protein
VFWLDQLLLWSILAFIGFPILRDALLSPVFGGWDGFNHVSIGSDYGENAWPDVTGWTPLWYLGMPFPNYYQPFFFWVSGLFYHLTPLSMLAVMRTLLLACTFLLPTACYSIGNRFLGGRTAGWAAGALAVYLMTRQSELAHNGMSLMATFELGLFAQLLAFVLILLWLLVLPSAGRSRRAYVGAIILFALVLLSNTNVLMTVAVLFLSFAVVDLAQERTFPRLRTVVGRYFSIGGWTLCLVMIWYLPLASTYGWVATNPLDRPGVLSLFFDRPQLMAFFGFGFVVAWQRRNRFVLAVALAVLVSYALVLVSSVDAFSALPIQQRRILANTSYLAVPVAAFFIAEVIAAVTARWLRVALAIILPGTFFVPGTFFSSGALNLQMYSPEEKYTAGEFDGLVQRANKRSQGRYSVEIVLRGLEESRSEESWYLNGLIARKGGLGLYGTYREASIGAFFTGPLRNAYSKYPHEFGISSRLSDRSDFLSQDVSEHRKRGRWFNLKYLLVKSDVARSRLEGREGFRKAGESAGWTVFEDTADQSVYAHVPRYLPYLVFDRWNSKKRPAVGGYDFLSIAEYMFLTNRLDPAIALSAQKKIDRAEGLERFGGLFLLDYRYDSLETAKSKLLAFAHTKPVLILKSNDPLCAALAPYQVSHRIRVVAPTPLENERDEPSYHRNLKTFLDLMETNREAVEDGVGVSGTEVGREDFIVDLNRAPARPIPVIAHQSYFPRWRDSGDRDVYLVSPALQLVFMDQAKERLSYRRGWPEKIGMSISLLALLALLVRTLRRRNPRV